jgi:fibronectin-binding autotransporter adhesin
VKKLLFAFATICLTVCSVHAANLVWTNTLGGSWHAATNWSPNTLPGTNDFAYVTNTGSYNVIITNSVKPGALLIGAGNVVIDNYATLSCANMIVTNTGTMTWSNAWLDGSLKIDTNAQLFCSAAVNTYIYSLTITNNGTVNWSSGGMSIGGTPATFIVNNGLWTMSSSSGMGSGGGQQTVFINNGTVRKTGSATCGISDFNFFNNGVVDVQGGTLNFRGGTTNLLNGSYSSAAGAMIQFLTGTYTDAGGTFSGAGVNRFNANTLNLRTNVPTGLLLYGGDIYITGTTTFQNAGSITNLSIDGATLRGTNTVTGTLNFSWGSITDRLTVASNATFNITSNSFNKNFYGATIINQGTVNFGAAVNGGGTIITNSGLWNMIGDNSLSYGGGGVPRWINTGTLRRTSGTSTTYVSANLLNLPGGLVDVQAATFQLGTATNGQLGGTFNIAPSCFLDLSSGTWTDAGGVTTGAGTMRLNGATLNLQTNTIGTMLLYAGTVNIVGTNFQNHGAITNLTLDGATLAGTNVVSGGVLTMNSGSVTNQLIIQTNGQVTFATSSSKFITPLVMTNLGTVIVNGGGVNTGTTSINNFGQWLMTGDYGVSYGGVGTMGFTNFGTFRKTAGASSADCASIRFFNQPGALVQVDTGTLLLPPASTNLAGTLRLNGGTLGNSFALAGGTLDGIGTFKPTTITGGTISPGFGSAGQMTFPNGLTLNSNVTLAIDGTGPAAGTGYDTLSVTGAIVLSNATLQVTAMPTVPAGTTFTLIANDGTDAINGTFAGLPENSLITVGAQDFRIHYTGGTGNDVTIVRDGVVTGPQLGAPTYATNSFIFNGTGAIPLTSFTVRASTNLTTWTNIGVVTSSANGTWTFIDTNAWRYMYRFYNTTN